MKLTDKLKNGIVFLDGAMGTQLQSLGLPLGTLPEEWNLSHPDQVIAVHRAYLDAGCDVVYANTFGANHFKFGDRTEEIVRAGVQNAKIAVQGYKDRWVALDVGSLGKMLEPLGPLSFEDAVLAFKRTIKAGVDAGADLVVIETINDVYELKSALVATKEVCSLPVFVTAVFGQDEKTVMGSTPETVVAIAESLGADAVGLNCSLAPLQMTAVIERMARVSSIPLIAKPNAGLPEVKGEKTVYSLGADEFACDMLALAKAGATVLGGCCGTAPEHLKKLVAKLKDTHISPVERKNLTVISSYSHTVCFGGAPVMIGERINPTGKKRLKQALKEGDIAYVLGEVVAQEEKGAHALDVNVGLPEIDEENLLPSVIKSIQGVTNLPLQIDTSSPVAMRNAVRVYNGVPLLNSVNGKSESMQAVFPIAKKYGGVIIALTLDESGIPTTAQGRVQIAKNIIATAKEYGIDKNRLIFDTLAMAVSADAGAGKVALDALREIRYGLGCNVSLGVSNVSFGLPQRELLNSAFLTMALANGLSAAIVNPNSTEIRRTFACFNALSGFDNAFGDYINFATAYTMGETTAIAPTTTGESDGDLTYCIIKGLKQRATEKTLELLKEKTPLQVIDEHIIPALNTVGDGFEKKTVFLPQLLISAETASCAFDVIKSKFSGDAPAKNLKIVVATVKDDIHDIGKNIVKTLLENYGFSVIDLGKDVPAQAVLDAVKKSGAKLVGLSALMTTTVVNMKEIVSRIKSECPDVYVMVGGAVLTKEYALSMGADAYCKDGMQAVRYAEEVERAI